MGSNNYLSNIIADDIRPSNSVKRHLNALDEQTAKTAFKEEVILAEDQLIKRTRIAPGCHLSSQFLCKQWECTSFLLYITFAFQQSIHTVNCSSEV